MNFDDELRGTLRMYAERAPDGQATMAAVQAREHRIRVRRFGGAGAAALLAVAAAVSTPYLLTSHHGSGTKPVAVVPAASPSKSATPKVTFSPVPKGSSKVELVPAAFTPVSFPMTPSSTPSGLMDPVAGIPDLQPVLDYYGTDYATTERFMAVSSAKTLQGVAVDWTPDSTTTISINGHQATLGTGTNMDGKPAVHLTWREHANLWIGVEGSVLTSAQVTQYARGLSEGSFSPPMPFNLALAPKGYQPSFQEFHPESASDGDHFCLAAPGKLLDQSSGAMVCVAVTSDAGTPQDGTPVQVGNDPGVLSVSGGLRTLQVLRPGFPFFVIQKTPAAGGTLSDSDLIRFAAGITKNN